MRLLRAALLVLMTIITASCGKHQPPGALPHYKLQVITGLPNHQVWPTAVNRHGDVLLWGTDLSGICHTYLWQAGKIIELGTLGGARKTSWSASDSLTLAGTAAIGLNDKGQVVGMSQTPAGDNHAILWEHGKMRDLGTLGGRNSKALGINNQGEVVGCADTKSGESHAFIWDSKTGIRDLGIPGKDSRASKINEKGQVLGSCSQSNKTFVWNHGDVTYLQEKPLHGFSAFRGVDINDRGDIIGTVDQGNQDTAKSRPFLWSHNKMIPVEVGAVPRSNGIGWDLTSDGLVVGAAHGDQLAEHAFVWKNGKHASVDDLLDESGWSISSATAVNEKGQIAAIGSHVDKQGISQYVILTPVSLE